MYNIPLITLYTCAPWKRATILKYSHKSNVPAFKYMLDTLTIDIVSFRGLNNNIDIVIQYFYTLFEATLLTNNFADELT